MESIKRKLLINFFDEVELKYDINSLTYKNICLWPLLKQYLFFANLNVSTETPSKYSGLFNSFKIKSLFRFLNLLLVNYKKSTTSTAYGMMSHFRHYDNVSHKRINKFYNKEILENDNNVIILDHSAPFDNYRTTVDNLKNTHFTFEIKILILIFRTLFFRKKINQLRFNLDFKDLIFQYEKHFEHFNIQKFEKEVKLIYLLSLLYEKLFKKQRVKKVYVLSYYLSDMQAMILAANKLNIHTVDMQHGSQGELHVAYNNYNKIPKSGYKALPRQFLCWNGNSASQINRWCRFNEYHSATDHGNPWVEYLKNNSLSPEFMINSDKPIILFTLQPIGDFFLEEYMIKVICNTKCEYDWYIRLHPRQLHLIKKFNEFLIKNDLVDYVEYEVATSIPLPILLQSSSLHISRFSGCIEEAVEMDVKSLIIDEIGAINYSALVKSGIAETNLTKSIISIQNQIFKLINV